MDRWRRRITVTLALGALLWIAGCGGSAEEAAPPAPVAQETQPEPAEPTAKPRPARKPRATARSAPDLRPEPREAIVESAASEAVEAEPAAGEAESPSPKAEPSTQRAASVPGARSSGRDTERTRSQNQRSSGRREPSSSPQKKSTGGTSSGASVLALGGSARYQQGTQASGRSGVDPVSGTDSPRPSGGVAPPPLPPTGGNEASAPPEPPEPTQVAQVVLQPDMLDVAPGSALTFHIWIYGGQDVASVPFHLQFNPEVLEFQGGHEGPFLSADGQPTVFMFAGGPGGESVVVGHSRLTRLTGANGTGELCVLNFVAKAEGNPGLAFDRASVIGITGKPQPSMFEIQSPFIH